MDDDEDLLAQYYMPLEPLAARMRPTNLDEYVGQEHILGEGRLLRRVIKADRLQSVIFYGPPGSGKTTLARVIANSTKSVFVSLNAVLSGVKELREELEKAKQRKEQYSQKTILFIDEVHRWNKSQQDALLPWVENGTIILIGATTENPFFEVNKALVSRSRVFPLTLLTNTDLLQIANNCIQNKDRGYGKYIVKFEDGALEHLVETAAGDARNLLNALELAVETSIEHFPPKTNTEIFVTLKTTEESIQKKVLLYDKEGDYHYDTISAFIKSIRGSDPDATLFWMAKMLTAGEDPRFIFRRMIISSCEDVGLADPNALIVVQSAAAAFDRIGLPEGRFLLSQAALYLATAKKSNTNLSFFDAIETVAREKAEVPNHLKDPSRDKEDLNHGANYLYPHAYKDHWVAQQYLPSSLQGKIFYNPSDQGYEKEIAERVKTFRELQLSSIMLEDDTRIDYSGNLNKSDEIFLKKLSSMTTESLKIIKKECFGQLEIKNYYNILNFNCSGGLFLWDSLRLVPNGSVSILCNNKKDLEILNHNISTIEIDNRPNIVDSYEKLNNINFEQIFAKDIFTKIDESKENIKNLKKFLTDKTSISLCQILPFASTRVSDIFKILNFDNSIIEQIITIEKSIFNKESNFWNNKEDLLLFLKDNNIDYNNEYEKEIYENIFISVKDIEKWFNKDGIYGKNLNDNIRESLYKELLQKVANKNFKWKRKYLFIKK